MGGKQCQQCYIAGRGYWNGRWGDFRSAKGLFEMVKDEDWMMIEECRLKRQRSFRDEEEREALLLYHKSHASAGGDQSVLGVTREMTVEASPAAPWTSTRTERSWSMSRSRG